MMRQFVFFRSVVPSFATGTSAQAPPALTQASAMFRGFLTKRAQSFPWNWKVRFAVFDAATKTLTYFKSEEDAAAGSNAKGQVRALPSKQLLATVPAPDLYVLPSPTSSIRRCRISPGSSETTRSRSGYDSKAAGCCRLVPRRPRNRCAGSERFLVLRRREDFQRQRPRQQQWQQQ
jgi:hypothetical protein